MRIKTFTGALAAPFLMAAAIIVMTSATAMADTDGKNYPANGCVVTSANKSTGMRVSSLGVVTNADPVNPLRLVCPITKDHAFGNIVSSRVNVVDRSNTEDVSCLFISANPKNGSIEDTGEVKSTGNTPETQQLVLTKDLKGSSFGYNVLQCRIPPATPDGSSGIVTYGVFENYTPSFGTID